MDIWLPITISIVSLIGVIVNSLIIKESNKNRNNAAARKDIVEAESIYIKIANDMMDTLKLELEEHKLKIEILTQDIEELKKREWMHAAEEIKLTDIIINLKKENKELLFKSGLKDAEIQKLKIKLNKLQQDFDKLKQRVQDVDGK